MTQREEEISLPKEDGCCLVVAFHWVLILNEENGECDASFIKILNWSDGGMSRDGNDNTCKRKCSGNDNNGKKIKKKKWRKRKRKRKGWDATTDKRNDGRER